MTKIQQILRQEGSVYFEGSRLVYAGEAETLQPGDTYAAERNAGPKLLTVRTIDIGAVFPVEIGYPYDLHECVKVEIEFFGSEEDVEGSNLHPVGV